MLCLPALFFSLPLSLSSSLSLFPLPFLSPSGTAANHGSLRLPPREVKAVILHSSPSGAPPLPSWSQSPAGQWAVESLLRRKHRFSRSCFCGNPVSWLGEMIGAWRHLLRALHLKTLSLWPPRRCFSPLTEGNQGMWVSEGSVSRRGLSSGAAAWNSGIPDRLSKTWARPDLVKPRAPLHV